MDASDVCVSSSYLLFSLSDMRVLLYIWAYTLMQLNSIPVVFKCFF